MKTSEAVYLVNRLAGSRFLHGSNFGFKRIADETSAAVVSFCHRMLQLFYRTPLVAASCTIKLFIDSLRR